MLEIRYDIKTKVLSAWCGSEARFGRLDRGRDNEKTAIIDSPIPGKQPFAWLYDDAKKTLIDNPDYKEPPPAIDKLKVLEDRVIALEQR